MREGPLADLFRDTAGTGSDDEQQPAYEPLPERPRADEPGDTPAAEETAEPQQPASEHSAPEPEPDAGEGPLLDLPEPASEVSVYRSEDEHSGGYGREDVLPEDAGPAYGREEPEPRPGGDAPLEMHNPVIRVIGVGGAGVNAINRMVESGIHGVEFMAVNTDLQSLQNSQADLTVHIGGEITRGLGSGSDPSLGYKAAFEEQDRIKRLLKGSDMVFVAAGAGGGTGTGAAPVVARLARDVGALTVGIVTKPFKFEGTKRNQQADEGIAALAAEVDTLITVPNERLLSVLSRNTSMVEAFSVADDVLRQGVQGISDLITLPAIINLDFADVRSTMRDAGEALLGIGMGTGDTRATFAAERAISSPLLETSIEGAQAILLSITGGSDLSLLEVSEAASIIQEAAHPDANIIFGANVDETLGDQIWITVIATRFDGRTQRRKERETSEHKSLPRPAARGETGSRRAVRAGDLDLDVPEFNPN